MIPIEHKLVVISNEKSFPKESVIINALFYEGLEFFHLRKPQFTEIEIENFISTIEPKHHHKIILHQYFNLIKKFNIYRLHQKSTQRNEEEKKQYEKYKPIIWSSSFHKTEELVAYKHYEYGFLSPIFNSISKPNYYSNFSSLWKLDREKINFPIIGLGGVCLENLEYIQQMNLDGIALLGAIWNNPTEAINTFKKINKKWKSLQH